MQFQIEVLSVQSSTKPTKSGSYVQLDVAYKRLDTGKVEGKKVMSFASKDAYAALQHATTGNHYQITTEKVGEYWQWIAVERVSNDARVPSSDAVPAKSVGNASPKSTYETPEERAKKQVYIIRQSSLSTAVDTLAVGVSKGSLNPDDVLALAQRYVDFVFDNNTKVPSMDIGDMDDDIPL